MPRHADATAVAFGSSSSELAQAAEQVIDQFRGFLAIPFLEPRRRAEYLFPVLSAERHCLVLKSAGAYRMSSIQGTPITRNATKKITPKIAPSRQ